MPTHLDCLTVDSADPVALGAWWAQALGWEAATHRWARADGSPGLKVSVNPHPRSGADTFTVPLTFVPSGEPKRGLNRLHLDLRSATPQEQQDSVSALEQHGAQRIDLGQGTAAFVVLADIEGNEFCVLEPREEYAETGVVASIVIKAIDPPSLARFWAAATGWGITASTPQIATLRQAGGVGPTIELIANSDRREGKNRWHLDVRPGEQDDHQAEVERLLSLGAQQVDIGQTLDPDDVTWVVLADPEGNEFCVLRPQ